MKQSQIAASIIILASLLLSACGSSKPEPTPTLSLEQIQTAAVVTFAAGLTQTALFQPPATLTPTPRPTNTLLPTLPISTQPTSTQGGNVTPCNNLVYVADVTIPDNTVMTPGQTFTKTWRVQNSGSCAWGPGYKFNFITGDAMGGQTVTLSQTINSGALYEISVPMTAPQSGSGTIKGEWRMSDPNGVFFGAQIWVQITLGGTATGTATTGPTSTATPTPTGTP